MFQSCFGLVGRLSTRVIIGPQDQAISLLFADAFYGIPTGAFKGCCVSCFFVFTCGIGLRGWAVVSAARLFVSGTESKDIDGAQAQYNESEGKCFHVVHMILPPWFGIHRGVVFMVWWANILPNAPIS